MLLLLISITVVLLGSGIARAQTYTLVSSIPSNPTCQTHNTGMTISKNGRWVFYESTCPDLSPGSPVGSVNNIYGYDLETGETKFVSVLPNRRTGASGRLLDVSADGRYVVFSAGIWPALGRPEPSGVYLRDLLNETTIRIGEGADYFTRAAISANGETVAFQKNRGPAIYTEDVYAWTRDTGQTTLVNLQLAPPYTNGGQAIGALVSADGRFVLFTSNLDNLVPSDTNSDFDVFIRDLWTQTTTLVSMNRDGAGSGNGRSYTRDFGRSNIFYNSSSIMSSDGRYVAFASSAQDLVPGINTGGLFVRDMWSGTTTLINANSTSTGVFTAYEPLISADGRMVSFWGNFGSTEFGQTAVPRVDIVYHRNLQSNQTSVLNSVYPNIATRTYTRCTNVGISADGRFELFSVTSSQGGSGSRNDLYIVDNLVAQTRLIGLGNGTAGGARFANMAADGRVVVFETTDKLVPEDDDNGKPDVYVYRQEFRWLNAGGGHGSH
jgi:hypothetical protein